MLQFQARQMLVAFILMVPLPLYTLVLECLLHYIIMGTGVLSFLIGRDCVPSSLRPRQAPRIVHDP